MISYRQADIVNEFNRLQFLEDVFFYRLQFHVSQMTRSYIPAEDTPVDITLVESYFMDAEWNRVDDPRFEKWKKELDSKFVEWLGGYGFANDLTYNGKVRPFTDALGVLPGHRNTASDGEHKITVTFETQKISSVSYL